MKFNIKNWQDKHLIKESKGLKREIDFKSDDAFKKYNAKHKMRKTTKVNIAGKDTTAGEESGKEKKSVSSASKLTPQQKKSTVSGAVEKMLYMTDITGYVDVSTAKLSRIYVSGMSIEDAKAELKTQMNPATNDTLKGISKYKQKKAEKEVYRLLDDIYTGKHDSYINDKNIRSGTDGWIRDPELDKRIKKNGEKQDAEYNAKEKVYWADYKKRQAAEKAEKLKNRTPKEIEKAKTQFRFSDSDYESPKEYRDNVKDILQKRYDLDKVDPKRMQQMIDGADDYFYHEARSANKAGRRAKTTSAKNFANYIEQYFDEDGIEPKNESVIRRSTRIREARMYRTIQELKGLEKGV